MCVGLPGHNWFRLRSLRCQGHGPGTGRLPDDDQAIRRGITTPKGEMPVDFPTAIGQIAVDRHLAERSRRLLTKNGEMIKLQLVERKNRETA